MATGITKAAMKFKDIISKSVQIRSGPPAVYQLKPMVEEIESLRKVTLGKKDKKQTNRTILLVGETGAGKSTLINALVNYAMGVKWEDDVWFKIVEEEKKSQAESQTSDVTMYQIFEFEGKTLPYSLTIVDTPGYGDTRGTERDDAISERLLDLLGSDEGVQEINAVGLVLAASVNRLSDRLRYILDSVVSLFGKNVEKKIVALVTHSDGGPPDNALEALEAAKIKCAKDEDNEPLHFMFNNRQSEEKNKKYKAALKSAWDLTTDGLSQFAKFLDETEAQKLMKTMKVLNERKILKACVETLRSRLKYVELQQEEVEQTEKALKEHEQGMKDNENFVQWVDEPYKVREDIKDERRWFQWSEHKAATSCLLCQETCHRECNESWRPDGCEVMEDGNCTVCTRKCEASDHVRDKWIFVIKTRKVQKTMHDVKEKYEVNKAEHKGKLSLLENLQKRIEELKKEKDKLLEETFQSVVKLEQFALKVDSLSTLVHLDFLIERMKEKGDTEKIQKLEEMRSRMDDGVRLAAQYKQAACGKEAKK